jgi:dUTP pyrophosphatase
MAHLYTWPRVPVRVKLLRPGCHAPKYMTDGAAGADVYADVKELYIRALTSIQSQCFTAYKDVPDDASWSVHAHHTVVIPLGFAIEIPVGFVGVIKGRSGHATRGSEGHVAFIDSDYRQECCMIFHGGRDNTLIRHGERIGQLAIIPVFRPPGDEFEIVNELSATTRQGGFGSTGK